MTWGLWCGKTGCSCCWNRRYEKETNDIINQYIVFCKVFDEQRKKHGFTAEAVKETIRICKDRDILKEYLSQREKEVVTIMTSLFDEEEIMKVFIASEVLDNERKIAERMIKDGKLTLEKIAEYVPSLSLNELKEIEAEILQPC